MSWDVFAVSKTCAVCGAGFEAKRAAAKYCGERCRKRAQRRPGGTKAVKVLELPAEPTSETPSTAVAAATVVELERAGRLETAVGQAALVLAQRIDANSGETGASLASLTRDHRAAMAEALRDAEVNSDEVDELKARRERKLAGR